MDLIAANRFTLEQLTEAYNQTRVDYIVPMPMNVARLQAYITLYDVDMAASWVATDGALILGLGMLGVRETRGWITRLGVLPDGRRQGTGRAITKRLLESATAQGLETIWIEVIQGNLPAYELFRTSGFYDDRELIVARRPPNNISPIPEQPPGPPSIKCITPMMKSQIVELSAYRRERPNWLNETGTLRNVVGLAGLMVEFEDGSNGWVCYKVTEFQLSHIVVEVQEGDLARTTASLLRTLHQEYPTQDAVMENLPSLDPTWRGYTAHGYFDAFRRIEMVAELKS